MTIEEMKQGEKLLKEAAEYDQIKEAFERAKEKPKVEFLVQFFTNMQNISSAKRKEQFAKLACNCIVERCNELIEKYNKEFEEL